MNKSEISRGLEALAGEGVPANADLWPQLQAQVGAKKRRSANPRRRAGALLATAAVVVLVLALGALTPTGTNAATNALGLIGLQPISAVAGGPTCTGPNGTADPIYTQVDADQFTIVAAGGAPLQGDVPTAQAMQMNCPDGYELAFNTQVVEGNAVLNFFGVTTLTSTTAAPGCVGEGGKVDVIHTETPTTVQPGNFTVTTTFGVPGSPMPVTAAGQVQVVNGAVSATQISCPEGYALTFDSK